MNSDKDIILFGGFLIIKLHINPNSSRVILLHQADGNCFQKIYICVHYSWLICLSYLFWRK